MSWRVFGCALGLLVACGDTDGTGGEGGAGGSPSTTSAGAGDPGCGSLAEQFTEPACGDCAEDACCDELLACDEGTDCSDLVACVAECEDTQCKADCDGLFPGGVAPRDAFDTCLSGSCSEPCDIITEGLCGTDYTTLDQACDDCIGGACCDPLTACIDDVDCSACLDDPSDPACDTDLLLDDVLTCFGDSCSDVCDG